MAKESTEQKLMHRWWVRGALALVFGALAYGFASLAIDSGSIFVYALAIFFLVWAFIEAKKSAKYLFSTKR